MVDVLNLNSSEGLDRFFDILKEFEIRAVHDNTYKLILIEGKAEYVRYSGSDGFRIDLVNGDKRVEIEREPNHYLVNLIAPGKRKQFALPIYITIEYREPMLAIEY